MSVIATIDSPGELVFVISFIAGLDQKLPRLQRISICFHHTMYYYHYIIFFYVAFFSIALWKIKVLLFFHFSVLQVGAAQAEQSSELAQVFQFLLTRKTSIVNYVLTNAVVKVVRYSCF